MTLVNKLTAIGDAIREKTGGTAELTLDQMVTEISGITGGGEVDTTLEDAFVAGTTSSSTLTTYTNDRVTAVRYGTFAEINSLKTVDLPNVTSIEDYAFYNCLGLNNLNAPNTTTIGARAFSGAHLSELNFPIVTKLGNYCFFGMYNDYTTVDLPKLTSTGDNTFGNNTSLVTVNLPEATSLGSFLFEACSSLKNVNIPKVTLVHNQAFRECSALETIEFPSLTELTGWGQMFYGCSSLTTVVIRNTTKVALLNMGNAFSGTKIASGTGYIYVPDELVDSYKVATNWVTYANQIKPLSEYVEVS